MTDGYEQDNEYSNFFVASAPVPTSMPSAEDIYRELGCDGLQSGNS